MPRLQGRSGCGPLTTNVAAALGTELSLQGFDHNPFNNGPCHAKNKMFQVFPLNQTFKTSFKVQGLAEIIG
jgi:hypothetical protein